MATCHSYVTGWWCNNHLEKYELVNGKDYPIYKMENKSHVPNHQPDKVADYSGNIQVLSNCEIS